MLEYGGQADMKALGDALRDQTPPDGVLLDVALFAGTTPQSAAPILTVLPLALRHNREVSLSFLNVSSFAGSFALDLLAGMKEGLKPSDRGRVEFWGLSEEMAGELDAAAKWMRGKNVQA